MKIFSSFNGTVHANQQYDYSAKTGIVETESYNAYNNSILVNLEALVHIKKRITK